MSLSRERQGRVRFALRRALVWTIGLTLTTAVLYGGLSAYQRWSDTEARLAVLESRAPFLAPAPTAAAFLPNTPAAAPPPPTAPPAPPKNLWTSGVWEREAQQYIMKQLAQTSSSANPPRRGRNHD
jgi:hypothetical protein